MSVAPRLCAAIVFGGLLVACAEGVLPGEPSGTPSDPDAGAALLADAAPGLPDAAPGVPDAAPSDPQPVTLSATTSDAIVSGHSVGCLTIEGDYHRENHYYRVFDLASFGVTGGLAVQRVEVGIEISVAGNGGTQPATLNLYELAGAFDLINLSAIGTASMDVPDLNGTLYQVPVTGAVAAGRSLVVELVTPDGLSAQNVLIVGSNAAGERGPTLIAAQECGLTTPTATNDSSIGRADMHWVVRAHGMATP